MFKQEPITSFSEIRLRISGMRLTEIFEIICRGDTAEISQYYVRYDKEGDRNELVRRAEQPAEAIVDLLDQCRVLRWDGFSGKNPPGVRDGVMFTFTAQINGKTVRADGSNNFPKHYRDFLNAVMDHLQKTEQQNL